MHPLLLLFEGLSFLTYSFRLLYVNNCKTVRSYTLYTLTSCLVNDNTTTLEVVSNYVSTSL